MTEETPNAKPRRASLIKATENIKSATKTAPKRKRRDDEYEVEAILSHIVVDGVTIYSVSWVGYPGEITEMTEDELQNCSELLNAYKEKAKAAGDVGLFLPASAQDGFNGSAENHSSMNGFANAHSSSPEILTKEKRSSSCAGSIDKATGISEAAKKKKKSAASSSGSRPSEVPTTTNKRIRRKRVVAPDNELGYTNGCVVDTYKGFSDKYNEPVVLVSYKEPLPAGFEDKQDEIVPIRIIAEADPQRLIAHLVELLSSGRTNHGV